MIGITGLKTHGKDTAFRAYRRNFWAPYFQQVMFAEAIKKITIMILKNLGMTHSLARRHVYGNLKEAPIELLDGKTARQLQQTLGTEWGRDMVHPDLWVKMALSHFDIGYKPRIFITDVRFPNEVAAIYARGGHVVRVFNPRREAPTDLHPSEAHIPTLQVSAELINDSTKLNLGRDMAKFVKHITGFEPNGNW